ncbi:MAG: bifunctional riboflavin kinase/FAD synthetase [Microthrixaceae bacterium]|nr:bifunctional riboflavin kinase/FAD synthetase [Microthrixaceae bacterium]MCO5318476.1 bifunctional riboflavin kinase/FAD synthetase [Microthrixaceae bacterium]
MQVIRDPKRCPRPSEGTVVTIGAYDGLHLGHRKVIADVCSMAAESGHASALVTFDRHPAQVIRPESAPLLLTDLDQKLELLSGTGLDLVVVVHFDRERANESAEDFVEEVLVRCLNARHVVVGEDFHFGHRRAGNVELLTEMGAGAGFGVSGIRLVGTDGHPARDDVQVSSTAIRRALHDGRLSDANRMLGRPHEMRGTVVAGDRRGRLIGFPTANVAIPREMLMPADGIYAGHLLRGGDDPERLPSAIYLGHRPTFYDETAATLLEVHVLDFEGDLYGESVGVTFEHRIRGDAAFDGVEALAAQLAVDCDRARSLLSVS